MQTHFDIAHLFSLPPTGSAFPASRQSPSWQQRRSFYEKSLCYLHLWNVWCGQRTFWKRKCTEQSIPIPLFNLVLGKPSRVAISLPPESAYSGGRFTLRWVWEPSQRPSATHDVHYSLILQPKKKAFTSWLIFVALFPCSISFYF